MEVYRFIFLGIDVDDQLTIVKNKANRIDKNIGFKNSCFSLPLQISLKVAFKIDSSNFKNIIENIINYYSSIKPFKIDIDKLEMYDNIIWIRMSRNKELDKAHDDLNKLLLDKYNIELHEYDLDYKYHTTLFMDDNVYNINEAYNLISKTGLPQSIMANQFIIGISVTGKLGSYSIYRKIKRK